MAKQPTFTTTFDMYSSQGVIGQGGTGVVYKAVDSNGKAVAVKLLSPEHAHGDRLSRFKNELMFCLRNKHPNILTATDHGVLLAEETRSPFYVMPFYEGSLRSALKSGMLPKAALEIFLKILDGVDAAHKQGVFHRDLKPENILVSKDAKQVVVADFGIAHFQEEELRTAVETKASERLANFQYASPEQRLRGVTVDHRCDIYSLGLILNELFTRTLALGSGYARIGPAHAEFAYLDEIVDLMLRQSPADRPASIEALKQLLISRGTEAVLLQKISESKKTVIPKGEIDDPLILEQLRIVDFDWQRGALTLIFSQPVTQGWIHALYRMGNFESLMNKGPEVFQFHGDRATIGAQEHEIQPIIDHFKVWIPQATRVYDYHLRRQIEEAEATQRNQLLAQQREAEQRARVLKSVKL